MFANFVYEESLHATKQERNRQMEALEEVIAICVESAGKFIRNESQFLNPLVVWAKNRSEHSLDRNNSGNIHPDSHLGLLKAVSRFENIVKSSRSSSANSSPGGKDFQTGLLFPNLVRPVGQLDFL